MERESVPTFEPNGHLTPKSMQALLDGVLEGDEAKAARAHVDACGRCRAEVEGWDLLFSEIDGLGRLEPRPGFGDRVLADIDVRTPERLPWAARILSWLGLGKGRRSTARHLGPRGFQEYLEEHASARQLARMEAHLESCARCGRELEGWRGLLVRLESLPALEPSPGFADGVMDRVGLDQAPAASATRAEIAARAAGWLRRAVPATRRGWAVASGMALAPTVALGTILYTVFSHPLLTPSSLAAFAWWKVGDLTRAVWGHALDRIAGSAPAFHAVSAMDALAEAPALAAGGGLVLAGLVMAASWILYRNLLSASLVDGRHAHASV